MVNLIKYIICDLQYQIKKLILGILLLFSANLGHSQGKEAQIDSMLSLFVDHKHFNGSILVAEHGSVVYKKGFGFANMEWQIPNTTNTRFKIASLGKQFTALMILQLVQEGKLALEGKICDYIPEYPKESGKIITIHQLLTHTSGIPNYHIIPDQDANQNLSYTREEYMALFSSKKLMFNPGTHYYYSNLGYYVLGCILERVSGKSYMQLIKEKIFEPSGMNNSCTEEEKLVIPNLASGYEFIYSGYKPARHRNSSQVFGAGHVITTVEDFFKYDKALHNNILLSDKYQKLINTPFINNYGYGWNIEYYPRSNIDSVTLASHDGGTYGFSSVAYRFIEDNKLIVALSNTSPYDMHGIASSIGRILYDREKIFPKKSYVERFAITLNGFGVDSAINQYYYLKKNESELYELDGVEFNLLGYNYLRNKQLKEAMAVFKINVEAFPNVGDPYDSLAEAYMLMNEKDLAILNYNKALKLDPNNSNAKVMLKKLQEKAPKPPTKTN